MELIGKQIEDLRDKLNMLIEKNGVISNNEEILRISEELDKLIVCFIDEGGCRCLY